RADNERRTLQFDRTHNYVTKPPTTPVFGVLPSGFGFIDLTRLVVSQIDQAMEAVKNTPGLIFDMRGYPNATAWALAPRVARRIGIGMRISRPEFDSPQDHYTYTREQTYTIQ